MAIDRDKVAREAREWASREPLLKERIERGQALVLRIRFLVRGTGRNATYLVPGRYGSYVTSETTCTCSDAAKGTHALCKHRVAVTLRHLCLTGDEKPLPTFEARIREVLNDPDSVGDTQEWLMEEGFGAISYLLDELDRLRNVGR